MSEHAKIFRPSDSARWMKCAGALALQACTPLTPSEGSEYADEGTAAHTLAAWCLQQELDAYYFIGSKIEANTRTFVVDLDMADAVQKYVNYVRARVQFYEYTYTQVELRIEQQVDFSASLGVEGGFGTADAQIIATDDTGGVAIETVDLKFGRGVQVDAEDNEQMLIYNIGLAEEVSLLGELVEVRQSICQPRVGHTSMWEYSPYVLLEFATDAREAAARSSALIATAKTFGVEVLTENDLTPGEKQCRWCQVKDICPAYRRAVLETVADGFVDETQPLLPQLSETKKQAPLWSLERLGKYYDVVAFIESWCDAIRKRVSAELRAGNDVPGYKLVEGRKGARRWTDEAEAEAMMKSMRLTKDTMYDLRLISVTTAEKRSKEGLIGFKQWPKLQALITQSAGNPAIAPVSDKRPAMDVTLGFRDETQTDNEVD